MRKWNKLRGKLLWPPWPSDGNPKEARGSLLSPITLVIEASTTTSLVQPAPITAALPGARSLEAVAHSARYY